MAGKVSISGLEFVTLLGSDTINQSGEEGRLISLFLRTSRLTSRVSNDKLGAGRTVRWWWWNSLELHPTLYHLPSRIL